MAWQSRVAAMERSYVQAHDVITTARRRGGKSSVERADVASSALRRDYDNMLRAKDARGNDEDASESASMSTTIERDVEANEEKTRTERTREVEDSAHEREGVSGRAADVVPGLDDFGPAIENDEERVMTKMEACGEARGKPLVLMALDAVRRAGVVGAAALFGLFLIFFGMAMFEEMQKGMIISDLRPDVGPGGFVDERTVAEEAEFRGESAKAAMLDVERETGFEKDARRLLRRQ